MTYKEIMLEAKQLPLQERLLLLEVLWRSVRRELAAGDGRVLPSVEEQIRRLEALSPDEWRKPFEAAIRAWDESEPAELESQPPSEDELSAWIEQEREQVYAQCRH